MTDKTVRLPTKSRPFIGVEVPKSEIPDNVERPYGTYQEVFGE